MKEPAIIKTLNSLEGISEEERKKYISLIHDIFYYNPDDYYSFMTMINNLNIPDIDSFFSNFNLYLDIRKKLETKINAIKVKNDIAQSKFQKAKIYCQDLKSELDGMIRIKELIQSIISKFDSPEIKEMIHERDVIQRQINEKNAEINAKKRESDETYEQITAGGGLIALIKGKIVKSRATRKIDSIKYELEDIERHFSCKCSDIVKIFHREVDDLSQEDKDLFIKHKDLGGFENYFAIKYDLTWYLHKGEPGRLFSFIDAIQSEITRYQEVLSDELENADELKKKIDSRNAIIASYEDHLDLFDIGSADAQLFKDYTKRYPGLRDYSIEELSELDEQKDARVLLPIVSTLPVKVKKMTLTR